MSDFYPACSLDDVEVGAAFAVDVNGTDVAIVRTDDGVYAIHDECSHASVALSEGEVDSASCEIECWLHGSMFDLRTGKPTGLPATEPVAVYPCKVVGTDILVDVDHPLNETEI
jgi:3-phenylpropionate/trans-cinnamate dioxygenase ferredoxin component